MISLCKLQLSAFCLKWVKSSPKVTELPWSLGDNPQQWGHLDWPFSPNSNGCTAAWPLTLTNTHSPSSASSKVHLRRHILMREADLHKASRAFCSMSLWCSSHCLPLFSLKDINMNYANPLKLQQSFFLTCFPPKPKEHPSQLLWGSISEVNSLFVNHIKINLDKWFCHYLDL